ncbi:formimidoylglutamate deiminase [Nocardioides fonticola]|uniref:Formimidoylglutamate deiminase n=1 Tax=Nocardioides fonticola TaxID=450363 RepID=A0ABP7XL92_9ACTN
MSPTSVVLERALVGDPGDAVVADDVRVTIADGVITSVVAGAARTASEPVVRGLTIPGLANAHSHVFHRALRGRTQRGGGSFWTWREQMYDLAARLTPDDLHELARAAYAEMLAVGITCVGEFHYLHHAPDGRPYDDPNAMGYAVVAAAVETGMRITLLDTCYLSSGFGAPVEGAQRRYTDGDADAWAARVDRLELPPSARRGAAIHSVRAVPADQLGAVATASAGGPLHVHLSEQRAENEACLAATGRTPTALLDDAGALGPDTSAVHATHLTDDDVARLGATRTHACFCPTTERDLGDGIGPSLALRAAGAPLTLGSDSHAIVDLFEEMRAVELHERLASERRGHWPAGALLEAATSRGHASLGWDDAGRIEVGARADLVVLDTRSIRTAGTGADAHTAVYAAGGADVLAVMVDGVWRDIDPAGAGARLDAVIGRLL